MDTTKHLDKLYNKAMFIVINDNNSSTSYLQRKLNIGYMRAGTIIEQLESNGILTSPDLKGIRRIIKQ